MASFLGKFAFGSSNSGGPQYFLTAYQVSQGENSQKMTLPGMAATSLTDTEKCILYASDTNVIIQLACLQYLTLNSALGWIELTSTLTDAIPFLVTPQGNQQSWQAVSGASRDTVGYAITAPNLSPILTVNGGDGILTTFVPVQITPPLSTIVSSKSGAHLDFRSVDLSGAQLSGIDFTGADFRGANLQGTNFTGCTLAGAHFEGAVLVGASFQGAILDNATFTGSKTDISQVSWGTIKSAVGIDFSGCHAAGTQLGSNTTAINCTGAKLSGADFSGANLCKLNFTRATASGTIMAKSCKADGAIFDGSDLTSLVAVDGSFQGASLQGVAGHGAIFAHANLSNANLARSQFGSKQLLLTLSETLAATLNANKYVTSAVISAFAQAGIQLSPQAAITVVTAGQSWTIADPQAGLFDVLNRADNSGLDVYREDASLTPASFAGATMMNTKAPDASFAGADLTRVLWYGNAAAGNHTDLSSAMISNALLLEVDFTQAQIAGTDFSESVLIQAKLLGTVIGPGADNRATNFSRAQLQGANFTNSTLLGALLIDAAVALPQGVPLFEMPQTYQQYLNTQGLPTLSTYFGQQGFPLGSKASIIQVQAWLIDNSSDTTPNAVKMFAVRLSSGQLKVFDNSTSRFLFNLPSTMQPFLQQQAPTQILVNAFATGGQHLALTAKITPSSFWQITNSSDAPGQVVYQYINIYPQSDALHVYGAVVVWLRDFPQLSAGAAFSATTNVQPALNPQSVAPSGYPRSLFDAGYCTWEQLMRSAT